MNRRYFLTAATWAAMPARAATKNATIELRYFRLRNGSQAERSQAFLAKHFLPAAQRAGAGPLGFFGSVVAEQSPFVLAVVSYPSMAAFDAASEKMAADPEFRKAFDEYNSTSELSYIRMENSL
ncbi:MAG: NIPSNAP family protein, partial [Bryobacteraceae bacterium]